MAARFFQGFAVSPAATVGLSIINDVSWEYERGFRVGLWVLAIDLGAVFGPLCMISAVMTNVQSAGSLPSQTNIGSHITSSSCS